MIIGRLSKAYNEGRAAARAGTLDRERTRNPRGTHPTCRTMYVQGYRDETARMERAGLLPQCELPLVTGRNSLTEGPANP